MPRHARSRLPVLMYHRVLAEHDPLQPTVPDAGQANTQFRVLSEMFKVLPLEEALPLQREGRLPAGAVCITFDDGYRDNHDVALPLLAKHGLTATFYVANGFLDGGRMFNDTVLESVRRLPAGRLDLSHWGLEAMDIGDTASRCAAIRRITQATKYFDFNRRQAFCTALEELTQVALPDDIMMSSEQVRTLSRRGMSIGGHTVNHPILAKVDDGMASAEISENRAALHHLTGVMPRTFAYPNGKPGIDYTPQHARMAQAAGYEAAVSTAYGVAAPDTDLYELPRFVLSESNYLMVIARMIRATRYRSTLKR